MMLSLDAALVNRMLELRVKDLAGRSPAGSVEDRRQILRKCLGLSAPPFGGQTPVETTGVIARDGYRIEKLVYESTPGVPVTAHLYLPEGEGRFPLILRPYDHWPEGKRAPVVQAGAVSFALHGFACLIVDSPGFAADGSNDNDWNERRTMGSDSDPFLAMGAPAQGRYVWDLMRGLDAIQDRTDIDLARVGVTGEGVAADTASYVYAIDDRVTAAVVVAGAESRELDAAAGCPCRDVPGVMSLGDRSDILGLRAPLGALMIIAADEDREFRLEGHLRTDEKLRKVYRPHIRDGGRNGRNYRFERVFSGHDYNRRMREAALAFFTEHLCGGPASPCRSEARPLTDGALNPYPSGTVDPADPQLEVAAPWSRPSLTFRELLEAALATPQPESYRVESRLAAWRKYGTLPAMHPGAILAIHDSSVAQPKEPGSIELPTTEIDLRYCALLGLSAAETLAQLLHVFLPGGPETWEASGTGMGTDPFTSMIASMKTLVSTPEAPPRMVVADGPVASMVARFLVRYRPGMEVQATHLWTSWRDAFDHDLPQNAQPLARYLDWI